MLNRTMASTSWAEERDARSTPMALCNASTRGAILSWLLAYQNADSLDGELSECGDGVSSAMTTCQFRMTRHVVLQSIPYNTWYCTIQY